MVPNPRLGKFDLLRNIPALDPKLSFAPGPKPNLPLSPLTSGGADLIPPSPYKTLAILVKFSDNASTVSTSFFDSLLFSTTANSLRKYYREVSYNKLDVVTVTLPSSLGWQTAPQTYSYYVDGNYCFGSYPRNCQRLTEDVVNLVNPSVDFSQYDNDGDGIVDNIIIIHAGSGAEFNGSVNSIWSHAWQTYNPPLVDGKYVTRYFSTPEYWLSAGDMTPGVYAHEMGHVLGLPDLYDVDYTSSGTGLWSLMSSGSWNGNLGDSPAQLDAWSRAFLGFTTPVDITSTANSVFTLQNIERNSSNVIYKLRTTTTNEYFLLENRQLYDKDAYLPGAGLLVWHIDENQSSNTSECRSGVKWSCLNNHYWVALEQADGLMSLEFNNNAGEAGDPFPGSTNNTRFNYTSLPNTTSYYSTNRPGWLLEQIAKVGDTITVRVRQASPCPVNPASTGTGRVSVSSECVEANYPADYPSISTDDKLIAFQSNASNLVPGDVNSADDIFVFDRTTGLTTRVSVPTSGQESNGGSLSPSISGNGRYVAFESWASNLVTDDSNGSTNDIFVFDRQTSSLSLVSRSSSGTVSNGYSGTSAISANGNAVAFMSSATNLTSGANGYFQIYVRDLTTAQTEMVSVSNSGAAGTIDSWNPAISADGRYVVFETQSALVPSDTNATYDVYVRDRITHVTSLVSLNSNGNAGFGHSAAISDDGRFVAFISLYALVPEDTNSVDDIYIRDLQNGLTLLGAVSPSGQAGSSLPDIATNSNRIIVSFQSGATDLVSGDTNGFSDVFIYDLGRRQLNRRSLSASGTQANNYGYQARLGNGLITFDSLASNLVTGDTNNVSDVLINSIAFPAYTPQSIVQIAPRGTVSATSVPFKWYTSTDDYEIWLSGPRGLVTNTTYDNPSCITIIECSVSPAITLNNGAYRWWVRGIQGSSYGPWGNGTSFTVTGLAPGIVTPVSPSGSTSLSAPTFVWSEDANAEWYYLWVSGANGKVIDQWYDRWGGIISCSSGQCSVTPSLSLTNGSYTFWVQAWGGGIYGSWSAGKQFAVTGQNPGVVTLVAPSGNITQTNPTFRWTDSSNAQWYYLWVSNVTTGAKVIDRWYDKYGGIVTCSGGTCSVTPTLNLTTGQTYQFWVQAWGGGIYGSWSNGMQFRVTSSSPEIAPTFMPTR